MRPHRHLQARSPTELAALWLLASVGVAFVATLFIASFFAAGDPKASAWWRFGEALVGVPVATRDALVEAAIGVDESRLRAEVKAAGVHRLDFWIAPQHLETLEQKRLQALRDRIHVVEEGDEVPGRLTVDEVEMVRIRARLKGDMIDHMLDPERLSLRVAVRGGDAVLGMSRFSIQRGSTRLGHYGLLLDQHLERSGILVPRRRYSYATMNGRTMGLMLVEDHFAKELIEAGSRRESVILAFDESPFWRQNRLNLALQRSPVAGQDLVWPGQFDLFEETLALKTFSEGSLGSSSFLSAMRREAFGLLRGYLAGNIAAGDTFDLPRYARFLAISHVWGGGHGLMAYNLRLYFNPVTRLFEPIAFDHNVYPDGYPVVKWYELLVPHLLEPLTADPRFMATYREALHDFAPATGGLGVVADLMGWERELLERLSPFGLTEAPFVWAKLPERVRFVEQNLRPRAESTRFVTRRQKPLVERPDFDSFLLAHQVEDPAGDYLELWNVTDRDVAVEAIERVSADGLRAPLVVPDAARIVPPDLPVGRRVRAPIPPATADPGASYAIRARFGADDRKETIATRSVPPLRAAKYRPMALGDLLAAFPFLERSGERELRIPAGSWRVDRHLLTPEGFDLRIDAGARLALGRDVRLVVRGALLAAGRREAPIELAAADESAGWAGLVVLQAGRPSSVEWTTIRGVSDPPGDDWLLTGAVTFYESPVSIVSSTIAENRKEDGLNVIRSPFSIVDSTFRDTPSDAIDVDFGTGRIEGGLFERIAGDAIDLSGSDVDIVRPVMREIGDKALSVGERTSARAEGLDVRGCGIGVAAKDGSHATVRGSRFEAVRIAAYMAYRKKPEYGPAELTVIDSRSAGGRWPSVAQFPSTIEIDGRRQKSRPLDVDKLYAEVP